MSSAKTNTIIASSLLLASTALITVQAESLEGEELAAYNAYCPAGNYRAVWAEPLGNILEGWLKLVCLNEDVQETSYWYITPENTVVSPEEAELPVYVRPMVEPNAMDAISALGDNDTIELLLDFDYDEPDVPSLAAYGFVETSYGSSGSATTGSNGEVESNYQINGQEVSAEEYQAWEAEYLVASRAQDAERDRLILEQVHLSLYDLVELNQWHDWVDVETVNNANSDNPRWEYKTSLYVQLTGVQARDLLDTSEELVYVSLYFDPIITTDSVVDNYTADLPTELGGIEAQSQIAVEPVTSDMQGNDFAFSDGVDESMPEGSSSGALHPASLILILLFRVRSRCRKFINAALTARD